MMVRDRTRSTRILLSFSSAYRDIAWRLAQNLIAANLEVQFDPWQDASGLILQQAVKPDLDNIDFVVPLLTPSGIANTWMSEDWKQEIYDQAIARNLDILPVRGERCEIPKYLSGVSFADLRNRDYSLELRRLVESIRSRSNNNAIALPPVQDLENPRPTSSLPEYPLILEVTPALLSVFDGSGDSRLFLDETLPMMRDGLFYELGVQFPPLHLRGNADLPPSSARILINEIPETEITVRPHDVLVNRSVSELAKHGIAAESAIHPASGHACAWISSDQIDAVQKPNLYTWDARNHMALLLASILRKRAASFLSLAAVQGMLDQIQPVFPHLVAETVPKTIPLFVLTDVLRRLVVEEVSIRDLRCILMTLAEWGRMERDPLMLAEYVRAGLKRAIAHRLGRGSNQLVVFLLHPDLETEIQIAIRQTPTGSYMDLKPERLSEILAAIREPLESLPNNVQTPQILTVMEIRAAVRRLIAPSLPNLHVVSYQDLKPDMNIQSVGRISLDHFSPRRSATVNGVALWRE